MMYRMFLDDERFPAGDCDSWCIVRSYDEAVEFVTDHGLPEYISFDHDLGEGKTGYDFAKWIVEYMMENFTNDELSIFDFEVHSQNPVGRENIIRYLDNYYMNYYMVMRNEKNTENT